MVISPLIKGRLKSIDDLKKFKEIDEEGNNYKWRNILKTSSDAKRKDRPKMFYKIEIDGKTAIPKFNGGDGRWTIGKEKYEILKSKGWIMIKGDNAYMREYPNSETKAESLIIDDHLNSKGTKDLQDIFGKKEVFEFPKPVSLIKYLISLVDKKDSIVLDFFAGSGTTGQAIMELNFEDKGKREFILCSNDEQNISTNISIPRISKLINSEHSKYSGNSLKVFYIKHIDVSLIDTLDDIGNDALKSFKLLNDNFKTNKDKIYYSLASLREVK